MIKNHLRDDRIHTENQAGCGLHEGGVCSKHVLWQVNHILCVKYETVFSFVFFGILQLSAFPSVPESVLKGKVCLALKGKTKHASLSKTGKKPSQPLLGNR